MLRSEAQQIKASAEGRAHRIPPPPRGRAPIYKLRRALRAACSYTSRVYRRESGVMMGNLYRAHRESVVMAIVYLNVFLYGMAWETPNRVH